jgi:hypothetical protein
MTWVAVAVGVGVGAAASGIQAGIKGGSAGDILESMAIGGAMGGVGGGIGGAIAGPAAGAAASGAEGATAQAATQAANQATAQAATQAANQGITTAVTAPLSESVGPQAIEQFGINSADAVVAPATEATPGWTPAGLTSISADAAPLQSATPLQQGITQGSQAASPGAFTNPVADELAAAAPGGEPSIYQPMTQEASANLAKQEAMVGSHAGDEGGILQATKTFEPNVPVTESVGTPVPKPNISGYVKQGANWLKANPEKAMIGGAVLLPLMSGGGGPNNGTPYQADNTNYLSPNFQRSVPQGYDPAKGYANGGGILSGIPGAGIYKDAFGSTIGQVVPGLGDELFGSNAPAAKPMNPIVAKALQAQQAQGAQGAQPAQGMQPATQAQPMQMTPPAPQQQPQQPQQTQVATQTAANGGVLQVDGHLGGYAHGGIPRLLSGAGDGVSDSIPATIAGKEPARLADGEFVVPARIVSELGNGSTEAGGKILQAMVDRVQARRSKTVGKGKVAVNSKARKDLPA